VLRCRATFYLDGEVVDAPAGTSPISLALLIGKALLLASQGDEAGARAALLAAIDRQPLLRAEAKREPLLAPLIEGLG
jgi:hypothetical protein